VDQSFHFRDTSAMAQQSLAGTDPAKALLDTADLQQDWNFSRPPPTCAAAAHGGRSDDHL
jgi:hypothetical protein